MGALAKTLSSTRRCDRAVSKAWRRSLGKVTLSVKILRVDVALPMISKRVDRNAWRVTYSIISSPSSGSLTLPRASAKIRNRKPRTHAITKPSCCKTNAFTFCIQKMDDRVCHFFARGYDRLFQNSARYFKWKTRSGTFPTTFPTSIRARMVH